MSDKECRAQEALAQLRAMRGMEEFGAWGDLSSLITSTAFARGISGDGLMCVLRDDRFVLDALGQHDARLVRRLRDEIVAVLAGESSVPRLTELLDEYDWRTQAATMLGWFGPAARAAIPKLLDVAGAETAASGAAKESVLLIGGAEEEIARLLRDSVRAGDDGYFRELSDLAMRAGYGASGWYLKTLEEGGRSRNADIRDWVAVDVGRLSAADRQRLKPTLELLRADPVDFVRQSASEVPDD